MKFRLIVFAIHNLSYLHLISALLFAILVSIHITHLHVVSFTVKIRLIAEVEMRKLIQDHAKFWNGMSLSFYRLCESEERIMSLSSLRSCSVTENHDRQATYLSIIMPKIFVMADLFVY